MKSKSMIANELDKMRAENAEKVFGTLSTGEKAILSRMYRVRHELLDHPLVKKTNSEGEVELVYDLEGDMQALRALWPLKGWEPGLDDEVYDLHSQKTFLFRNCQVIRVDGFNMLVAEDYLNTGGTAVDLVNPKDVEAQAAMNSGFMTFVMESRNGMKIMVGDKNEKDRNSESKP